MRRKAVTAWCAWEPGWSPDPNTLHISRELARHSASMRGWDSKYVIRVEIRPARKAKARRKVKRG